MLTTVPCTTPRHGVVSHVAGSDAARNCTTATGRHRSVGTLASLPVPSSVRPTVPGFECDEHVAEGRSGFADFLRTEGHKEFERVTKQFPDYEPWNIAEEVSERLMAELTDIDGAWKDLHPSGKRSVSVSGDIRARRADLSVYIEQYTMRNF